MRASSESEAVNHPKHYTSHPSGVECIDVVEHMTFNAGNAVKYLWRAGLKDAEPTLRDLEKARWYVDREIERVKRFNEKSRNIQLPIVPTAGTAAFRKLVK